MNGVFFSHDETDVFKGLKVLAGDESEGLATRGRQADVEQTADDGPAWWPVHVVVDNDGRAHSG